MPLYVWLSTAFTFCLNHYFYSNLMPNFKLCDRLLYVIPIFFLCLFSLNMFYYILEKGIFTMPLHVLLSTAFTFYLNHYFYQILMPNFMLGYRLLYVIPIFFLCLFSLNMFYYILEKGIFAMPLHLWLSTALTFYLNHYFYSILIPNINLCYRLLSFIPIFFFCLFSLNMFYYI